MSFSVKKDPNFKFSGDHHKFLQRIKKTLYYGSLSKAECLSLPVTELAAELFSQPQHGHSLERLQYYDAAKISRNACVSPCSLVLAVLYLERLKLVNPDFLLQTVPSELFLVSLMISSKFLHDDGEADQVFIEEWAASGKISPNKLIQLEKEFLNAIEWEIYITEYKFWEKLIEIEKLIARKEGSNRNWFTYTELENLLNEINVKDFFNYICALSTVLMITYLIGFFLILGAVHVVSKVPGNYLTNSQNIEEKTTHVPLKLLQSNQNVNGKNEKKSLDAADVLKAGILLASIKTPLENNSEQFDLENADRNYISWDWWNCSSLTWLAKTSKIIESVTIDLKWSVLKKYQEKCHIYSKIFELEDQIHKATKMRLQDQIERNWHEEWTDIFKKFLIKSTF